MGVCTLCTVCTACTVNEKSFSAKLYAPPCPFSSATMSTASKASGVLVTALFGARLLHTGDRAAPADLPTVQVNQNSQLLSEWLSETSLELGNNEPLNEECNFFNFSSLKSSLYCDAFTLARVQSRTLEIAHERAVKCSAKFDTDCILSHEIGLAVPGAFIMKRGGEIGLHAVIAPRKISTNNDGEPDGTLRTVRVVNPVDSFFSTTRAHFHDRLEVEFMSPLRSIEKRTFTGSDAFCVELLFSSYENDCWAKLDGL